ncbi:hypothetical protein [uncultured Leifsonia sp.]|nr:hypothetical protein [uncultured Leifsonia sp.]
MTADATVWLPLLAGAGVLIVLAAAFRRLSAGLLASARMRLGEPS